MSGGDIPVKKSAAAALDVVVPLLVVMAVAGWGEWLCGISEAGADLV